MIFRAAVIGAASFFAEAKEQNQHQSLTRLTENGEGRAAAETAGRQLVGKEEDSPFIGAENGEGRAPAETVGRQLDGEEGSQFVRAEKSEGGGGGAETARRHLEEVFSDHKECSLSFALTTRELSSSSLDAFFEDESLSVEVTYRGKKLASFSFSSTISNSFEEPLYLPPAAQFSMDEVSIKVTTYTKDTTASHTQKSLHLYQDSETIVGQVRVKPLCVPWPQLVENVLQDANGDGASSSDILRSCVQKSTHFYDNENEFGRSIEDFMFARLMDSSGLAENEEKEMIVHVIHSGLNSKPNMLGNYMLTDNGGLQVAPSIWPQACHNLIDQNRDFVLIYVAVPFPQREVERLTMLRDGILAYHQYALQHIIDPLLETLASRRYGKVGVMCTGYSMGGMACLNNANDLGKRMLDPKYKKIPSDVGEETQEHVLDPYSAHYPPCARKAVEELNNVNNMRSQNKTMVETHFESFHNCLRKKKGGEKRRSFLRHLSKVYIASVFTLASPISGWSIWVDKEDFNRKLISFFDVSKYDENNHHHFHTIFNAYLLINGLPLRKYSRPTLFDELNLHKGNPFLTLLGKMRLHDGKKITLKIQQMHGGQAPKSKGPFEVLHANLWQDNSLGFQAKISSGLNETGFMNQGNWDETPPSRDNPSVTFQCSIVQRIYYSEGISKKADGASDDNYDTFIDETTYSFHKITIDSRSPALRFYDKEKGGPQNFHTAVGVSKLWTEDDDPLVYHYLSARVYMLMRFIVDKVFSPHDSSLCTFGHQEVTVSRSPTKLTFPDDVRSEVPRYTLLAEATRRDPLTSEELEKIRDDITICGYLGQNEEVSRFASSIKPKNPLADPPEWTRCYTDSLKCFKYGSTKGNVLRIIMNMRTPEECGLECQNVDNKECTDWTLHFENKECYLMKSTPEHPVSFSEDDEFVSGDSECPPSKRGNHERIIAYRVAAGVLFGYATWWAITRNRRTLPVRIHTRIRNSH